MSSLNPDSGSGVLLRSMLEASRLWCFMAFDFHGWHPKLPEALNEVHKGSGVLLTGPECPAYQTRSM